jgi:DNA-binding XRE family transcriptional regulator
VVDWADIRAARRALGAQLAAAREAAGLIQQQLADQTVYSRGTIANAETGRQNVTRPFWIRCDGLLGTGTALVDGYDEVQHLTKWQRAAAAVAAQAERQTRTAAAFPSGAVSTRQAGDVGHEPEPEQAEDVIDVLRRLHRWNTALDPDIIGQLAVNLQDVLTNYEHQEHRGLLTVLVKQRNWIEALLDECRAPDQRRRLFDIAAGTAGLLGYIAVGRGNFPLARAYCAEAFQLGNLAHDPNLQAWARGTHSFCEYYAGRYDEALHLALDGLRYAKAGPQSVRLIVNGAARALGKLGDVDGVRRAVGDALDLMSRNDPPPGLPSSIITGCYSAAQTASNAATAYVSLGMADDVRHYVAMALPEITASQSPWSQSLVTIDLAVAAVIGMNADLEHASRLAVKALNISAGRPIISVHQRVGDLVTAATARWGQHPHVETIRDALATATAR